MSAEACLTDFHQSFMEDAEDASRRWCLFRFDLVKFEACKPGEFAVLHFPGI
jgi:hypothetical protein